MTMGHNLGRKELGFTVFHFVEAPTYLVMANIGENLLGLCDSCIFRQDFARKIKDEEVLGVFLY